MRLTLEELKEILDYNPETGIFTWRQDRLKVKAGDVAGGMCEEGYLSSIKIDYKFYSQIQMAYGFTFGEMPNRVLYRIDYMSRPTPDNISLKKTTTRVRSKYTKWGNELSDISKSKSDTDDLFVNEDRECIVIASFGDKVLVKSKFSERGTPTKYMPPVEVDKKEFFKHYKQL